MSLKKKKETNIMQVYMKLSGVEMSYTRLVAGMAVITQ